MLTREEQEQILRKAAAMRHNDALRRRRLEKSEMSPKRYAELREQDEDEMRDLLKEVG